MNHLKYAGFLHAPQGRENACSHSISQSGYTQGFFEGLPKPSPTLSFEPVPSNLKLGAERFFLVVSHGDRTWKYPIQLLTWETGPLARRICRWDWRLDADGVPVALSQLHSEMEKALDGLPAPAAGGVA